MSEMRPGSVQITWPAERFYWAALDRTVLPPGERTARRHSRPRLGYLFESLVPVPIEDLHAVYVEVGSTGVLACGIERDILQRELPSDAMSLRPTAVPACIPDSLRFGVSPAQINLLTGDFLPPPLRRLRRRAIVEFVIAWYCLCTLVMIGLERRIALNNTEALQTARARTNLYDDLLGPAASPQSQPRHLQLTAELRRLQQTRDTRIVPRNADADATLALAALLARWPSDPAVYVQTQVLSVSPGAISIRASMPDTAAAQALAKSLAGLPGWRMAQPAIRSAGGRTGDSLSKAVEIDLDFVAHTPVSDAQS